MSHDHDHDRGLRHDLPRLLGRRRALAAFAAAALLAAPAGALAQACVVNSRETAGPFPADGTNRRRMRRVNVLTEAGVVREDLRPSFAGMSGAAEGVPLTLELTLVAAGGACGPLAGHAVYLWHCDATGRYSLYDLPERNYLRGVGLSDAAGRVRFTTVFPGCYAGRWPHLHLEVFASAAAAVDGGDSLLTSQVALPGADCAAVYAAEAGTYAGATANLSRLSFESDMIFADNSAAQKAQQMLQLDGAPGTGFTGRSVIGLG